jgi:hypothetical protein
MIEKKIIQPRLAEAAGVENARSVLVGGKLKFEKVVKAGIEGQYNQVVTLKTGPVRVLRSDDDNIAGTILRNIKNNCRTTIEDHLKKRRMVFVADIAIQARDYDAVVERVAAGGFSAWLSSWVPVGGEVTARMSSKSRSLAPNTYVTIALVPAEIGDRQSVNYADIGRTGPSTASSETARPIGGRIREARSTPRSATDWISPRQVQQYAYAGKAKSRLKMAKPSGRVAQYATPSL